MPTTLSATQSRGLALTTKDKRPIPNRIIRSGNGESQQLCTLFGGGDYSVDGPYFYYIVNMFLERGIDCLLIDRVWGRDPEWLAASRRQREDMARDEAEAILDQVLGLGYRKLSLVAKSLGTRAMIPYLKAHTTELVDREAIAQIIWLTPSLGEQWSILRSPFQHYVVIGSEDKLYGRMKDFKDIPQSVIPGGDHGLDAGTPAESAAALAEVLPQLAAWLDATSAGPRAGTNEEGAEKPTANHSQRA